MTLAPATSDTRPAEQAVLLIELGPRTLALDLDAVCELGGAELRADTTIDLPRWALPTASVGEPARSMRCVRLRIAGQMVRLRLPAEARLSTTVVATCRWPELVAALGPRAGVTALLALPNSYGFLLDVAALRPAASAEALP